MDDFNLQKQELAADDALKSRIGQLQDGMLSLQQQIDASADLDLLAGVCETAWQQIKSVDIVLHEVLIHDHLNPDFLEPPPTDGIAECVNAALAQVRGVMADEYDLDVARKRLHMACSLARRALENLDAQVEAIVAYRTDPQSSAAQSPGW